MTLAALFYLRVLRPWQLTWGATPKEVAHTLPGDDLVQRPTFCATRAISIAAPAERIFPWLVQVDVKRAGWYPYDWLDNLGRPSARQILPEFQHVEPGQLLPMSTDGKQGIRIYSLDPPTSMVWGTPGDTTWAWQLDSGADGTTRVITRVRSRYRWMSPTILFSALLEFAVVERISPPQDTAGGPSSTLGTYSTSWIWPSKVRLSVMSRATSG